MSRPYSTYTQLSLFGEASHQPVFKELNSLAEMNKDQSKVYYMPALMMDNLCAFVRGLSGHTKASLYQMAALLIYYNFERKPVAEDLEMQPNSVADRMWNHGIPVRDARDGYLYLRTGKKGDYVYTRVLEKDKFNFLNRNK